MSQPPDDEHYNLVAERLLEGAVVPFLGAGVNLCDRPPDATFRPGDCLPNGSELAKYLADKHRYPGKERSDLLRVSQYVDVTLGSGPLYESLHRVFDADYKPTCVHRLLASLPQLIRRKDKRIFPFIFTTNYDDALERAFVEAHEPYDLVSYIAEGSDRGRFKHTTPSGNYEIITVPNKHTQLWLNNERPVIVKLHGAVDRHERQGDSFVITEDDYIAYLGHADVPKLIPVGLASRMSDSHLLFLGYSLRDWNLRVILYRLWGERVLEYNSWAIRSEPSLSDANKIEERTAARIEERTWARRGVEVLNAPLDQYVAELRSRLSDPPETGAVA